MAYGSSTILPSNAWVTFRSATGREYISIARSFAKQVSSALQSTAIFISPKTMTTMANYSLKRTAEGRLRYYHASAAAAA